VSSNTVEFCLDGVRQFTLNVPAGKLQSKYKPHIGKNVVWTPSANTYWDGRVDDLRVFNAALPCN
jgi:hypothetical protein